jgi:hypothetical protein
MLPDGIIRLIRLKMAVDREPRRQHRGIQAGWPPSDTALSGGAIGHVQPRTNIPGADGSCLALVLPPLRLHLSRCPDHKILSKNQSLDNVSLELALPTIRFIDLVLIVNP